MRRGGGSCLSKTLRELSVKRVDVTGVNERQFIHLINCSLDDFGMGVSEVHDGKLRDEVDVLLSVNIGDGVAFAALEDDLKDPFVSPSLSLLRRELGILQETEQNPHEHTSAIVQHSEQISDQARKLSW